MGFEKIVFKDNNEKKDFDKYLKLKSKCLYNQVYKVLSSKFKKINYYDFSSLIRYDKSLRDLLYKYLATFEEYIKVIIFDKLTYLGNKDIKYNNYQNLDIQKKDSKGNMKLYYHFKLELAATINFLSKFELITSEEKDYYNQIKKLRNSVMHFNILILGKENNYEKALKNKNKIENQITILKNNLPCEYQSGFMKDLDKLIINKPLQEFKINIKDKK